MHCSGEINHRFFVSTCQLETGNGTKCFGFNRSIRTQRFKVALKRSIIWLGGGLLDHIYSKDGSHEDSYLVRFPKPLADFQVRRGPCLTLTNTRQKKENKNVNLQKSTANLSIRTHRLKAWHETPCSLRRSALRFLFTQPVPEAPILQNLI